MNKYEEALNYFLSEIERRHIWLYFDKSKDDLSNYVTTCLNFYKMYNEIYAVYI